MASALRHLLGLAALLVSASGYAQVGRTAPGFALVDESGVVVGSADLAGRPYLVNFWAPWCAPCQTELPLLAAAAAAGGAAAGLRIVLVGVDAGPGDGPRLAGPNAAALIWLRSPTRAERRSLSAEDGVDSATRVHHAFGVHGLPTTMAVDAAGSIVAVRYSALDAAQLAELIAMAQSGGQ